MTIRLLLFSLISTLVACDARDGMGGDVSLGFAATVTKADTHVSVEGPATFSVFDALPGDPLFIVQLGPRRGEGFSIVLPRPDATVPPAVTFPVAERSSVDSVSVRVFAGGLSYVPASGGSVSFTETDARRVSGRFNVEGDYFDPATQMLRPFEAEGEFVAVAGFPF